MAASAAPPATGRASTPSSRRLRRLEDDQTLLVQSGKPVGVFRTHADAPRVLIANSNLVPRWATWEHFNELDRKGLMMYGQMTAGSWIYIGAQGIVQGTYETFVEMGRQHYGGDLCRPLAADRRPRRHGRRPAAGGGDGRAPRAWPSSASRPASRCGCAPAISTRQPATSTRRWRSSSASCREREAGVGRPARQRRRDPARAAAPAACGRTCSPTRPRAHDPVNGYLPAGWTLERVARPAREQRSRPASPRRPRPRWPIHVAGHAGLPARRRPHRRLRQQHPPDGQGGGRDRRLRLPGLRAGLYPPAVLPRRRAVPLGGAQSGDPEDIYRTDAKVKELMPRRSRICTTGSTWPASGSSSRACRRGSAGWAWATGTASAWPSTRWWPAGELKAPDRHRPRSPGFRLGRLAQSRDRGHARRLRRRLRLAAAQRPAQHRLGRDLGLDPSRRRGRHGLFPARRHGHRLRRHARRPPGGSSACCGTIRPPASCATPTPATTSPSTARATNGLDLPSSPNVVG